jgi:1-deoxy-D-xylulose-5-phosphate synthase
LLHIITKKGAGFEPAENERIKFHAISKIEKNPSKSQTKFQDIFGEWLCDKAAIEKKLVAITPAMKEGSGMVNFEKQYPDRFYDVAIAEQHAVTFGAGLALGGMKPVVAIYSTFLQRAYDQLIHDVCLENIDVTFALDRAGIVGEDGPTHSGSFDISFMRCIPNLVIATPSDEDETRVLLNTCFEYSGPAAVRYPRGSGCGAEVTKAFPIVEIGKGRKIKDGEEVCILNFGVLIDRALEIAQEKNYGLYDMRFVKPLDEESIDTICKNYSKIITLEDHTIKGGCGSAVNEYLLSKKLILPVLNLGLNDSFPEHGSRNEILKLNGLDVDSIKKQISNF